MFSTTKKNFIYYEYDGEKSRGLKVEYICEKEKQNQ